MCLPSGRLCGERHEQIIWTEAASLGQYGQLGVVRSTDVAEGESWAGRAGEVHLLAAQTLEKSDRRLAPGHCNKVDVLAFDNPPGLFGKTFGDPWTVAFIRLFRCQHAHARRRGDFGLAAGDGMETARHDEPTPGVWHRDSFGENAKALRERPRQPSRTDE